MSHRAVDEDATASTEALHLDPKQGQAGSQVSLRGDPSNAVDASPIADPTAASADRTVPKIVQQFEHPDTLLAAAAGASSIPKREPKANDPDAAAAPLTPKRRGLGSLFRKWTGTSAPSTTKAGKLPCCVHQGAHPRREQPSTHRRLRLISGHVSRTSNNMPTHIHMHMYRRQGANEPWHRRPDSPAGRGDAPDELWPTNPGPDAPVHGLH